MGLFSVCAAFFNDPVSNAEALYASLLAQVDIFRGLAEYPYIRDMKKKEKKALVRELERILDRNRHFCARNECVPTMYMEGVDDCARHLKKFVKKLAKKGGK